MGISYQFKQLCRQSDEAILKYLQTGERITPIEWPQKLYTVNISFVVIISLVSTRKNKDSYCFVF